MGRKLKLAIIGAGLAGLAAAYRLSKQLGPRVSLSIFESAARPGGRILTRTSRPNGEHGAEYLLGSELLGMGEYSLSDHGDGDTIKRLFTDLNVEWTNENEIPSPAYFWKGIYYPRLRLETFVDRKSASMIRRILSKAQDTPPYPKGMFTSWLKSNFPVSPAGMEFVDMILAGETCTSSAEIPACYALGCLNSAISSTETWHRIKDGSDRLINAFNKFLRRQNTHFYFCTRVSRVTPAHGHVRIEMENRVISQFFDGVIITSPNGECLLGRHPIRFHSYVSVLIPCARRPRVKGDNTHGLADAVYLNSPLNFLQFRLEHKTLRVLIPTAELILKEHWSKETVVAFIKYFLDQFVDDTNLDYRNASVEMWKYGLPLVQASTPNQFVKHAERIFLAGDRFSKWPSMAGAIVSGSRAAEAMQESL